MQVCESASVPTRARLFRVVTADRNICTTSQRFTTAQHFTPSHWVTGRNSTAVKLSSYHRGRGQGNLWSVKRGFGPLLSLSWQLQIQTCEKRADEGSREYVLETSNARPVFLSHHQVKRYLYMTYIDLNLLIIDRCRCRTTYPKHWNNHES